ncbi:MAG: hypothetical protein AAF840_09810 [Bacteroidota bacterium]
MHRILPTLLFLFFLAPALRAQTNTGSGSLVALMAGDGDITISISSATEHQLVRYAPALEIQRFPLRYRGYEPHPYGGWGDWRVIHEKVNELVARGWQLNNTNMSASGGGECGPLLKHIHYHFTVPEDAEPLATNNRKSPLGKVVLEASINQMRDFNRRRGALIQRPDSSFVLLIENFENNTYLPFLWVVNKGVASKDLATKLATIEMNGRRLALTYALDDGNYRYDFIRTLNDYRLVGLSYTAKGDCGIQELDFNGSTSDVAIAYTYRTEPCAPEEPARSFNSRTTVPALKLSEFTPLKNTLSLPHKELGEFRF